MSWRKSNELVEIESGGTAVIGQAAFVQTHQTAIDRNHRAARRKSQHRSRLRAELGTTPSPETESVWRAIETKVDGQ